MYEKDYFKAMSAYEGMMVESSERKNASGNSENFAISCIGGLYLAIDGEWGIKLVKDIKDARKFATSEEAQGYIEGIIKIFEKCAVAKA